jgi:hypothetical protein
LFTLHVVDRSTASSGTIPIHSYTAEDNSQAPVEPILLSSVCETLSDQSAVRWPSHACSSHPPTGTSATHLVVTRTIVISQEPKPLAEHGSPLDVVLTCPSFGFIDQPIYMFSPILVGIHSSSRRPMQTVWRSGSDILRRQHQLPPATTIKRPGVLSSLHITSVTVTTNAHDAWF